ncbi:MAG: hypothetical protein IJQ80_08385, partial [Clostridia bacterium]|nr:hypothetical protein [Clostridia bacterium]
MSFTKKFLSFVLILAMLISACAYAAPSLASGSTVESITVTDVEVDHNDVYVTYGFDGKPYIRYNFTISFTAVMSNNATVRGTGTSFTYNGDEHQIAIRGSTQDQVEWKPGNAYDLVAIVDDTVTDEFRAYVSGPNVTVDFRDAFVIENYGGYADQDSNGAWMYHYRLNPRFTARLADGTHIDDGLRSPNVFLDGTWYEGVTYDPQKEHPFSAGNTYKVAASFLGVYGYYNVTVVECPVDYITVGEQDVTYRFGGYTDSKGNYNYSLLPLNYVVHFKDGTEASPDEDGQIYWHGEAFSLFLSVTGEEMGAWQAGHRYTVSGKFMGYSVRIPVNVHENTYTNLTIAGSDKLTLTFKKSNGTNEIYHVRGLMSGPIDPAKQNVFPAMLYTDENVLMYADFVFPAGTVIDNEYMFEDPFYVIIDGLKSNMLSGCKWLTRYLCPSGGGPDGDANGDDSVDMKD